MENGNIKFKFVIQFGNNFDSVEAADNMKRALKRALAQLKVGH